MKIVWGLLEVLKSTGMRFKIFMFIVLSNIILLLLTHSPKDVLKIPKINEDYSRFLLPIKPFFPTDNIDQIIVGLTSDKGRPISKRAILHLPPIGVVTIDEMDIAKYMVDIPNEDSSFLITKQPSLIHAFPINTVNKKRSRVYEINF